MIPEELAESVLKDIIKQDKELNYPIDPFKLLKDNGVIVAFSEFEKVDGIIINDVDNVTIVGINCKKPWTRQRFTAAHEYCHFIKDLKKEENTFDSIECFSESKAEIEKFAETFARYLLIPEYKLKELCDGYKNEKGFIDFENVTRIAEFFGVSFKCCLNRIAYDLKMIDGDISSKSLYNRAKVYRPELKRKELIETNNDYLLIGNAINGLSYCMVNLQNNIGARFLNNYIYYDNKLEGIDQGDVPYILADLSYNKENSEFFNSKDENVIMTLGNYELQKYVLTTEDEISIKKCRDLHKILHKYTAYPQYAGNYRENDAVVLRGTMQPTPYYLIPIEIENLEKEFEFFYQKNKEKKNSEYIESAVYFIYKFIRIHPFSDGNGRVSRAMLNWMLRLKNIPPIYIDDKCRDEYYDALAKIDLDMDYVPFIVFVEKRIINTLVELHDYLFIEEV